MRVAVSGLCTLSGHPVSFNAAPGPRARTPVACQATDGHGAQAASLLSPSALKEFQLRTRPVRAALLWRCMACKRAFCEGVALAEALGSTETAACRLPVAEPGSGHRPLREHPEASHASPGQQGCTHRGQQAEALCPGKVLGEASSMHHREAQGGHLGTQAADAPYVATAAGCPCP